MNLESDYITQLTNNYFSSSSAEPSGWGEKKPDLISITSLAEIFNQYIDSAQESNNFKNLESTKENKEFLLALSHNLLFVLSFMKMNNLTYKDLFDDYIKHNKLKTHSHPEWPVSTQIHSID